MSIIDIYNDLYSLEETIYKDYDINNKEKIKNYVDLEDKVFNKLDLEDLSELLKYSNSVMDSLEQDDYEDYEILLYGEEPLLIARRLHFKIYKYYNEYPLYEGEYTETAIKQIEENKYFVCYNLLDSFLELDEKIYAEILMRFLFLLSKENIDEIKDENLEYDNYQYNYLNKISFINPYIEEKLFENSDIEFHIKIEDNLYNELWEYVKVNYVETIVNTLMPSIKKNIVIMHSKRDINNDKNTLIRETFLRTSFSFLDPETIAEINYKYREENFEVYNKVGYQAINNAFRRVNQDKEIIKKIKTL